MQMQMDKGHGAVLLPAQRRTPPVSIKVYSCLFLEIQLFCRHPAASWHSRTRKYPRAAPRKFKMESSTSAAPVAVTHWSHSTPTAVRAHRGRQVQKWHMDRNSRGSSTPRGTMMTALPSRFMMLTGLPVFR